MVDKVEEVIQINKKEILPPPNIGNAFQSEYIEGMYKKDDKTFIMIIDIDKVLSLKEIVDLGDLNQKNIKKALDNEDDKKDESVNTDIIIETPIKKIVSKAKAETKKTTKKPKLKAKVKTANNKSKTLKKEIKDEPNE